MALKVKKKRMEDGSVQAMLGKAVLGKRKSQGNRPYSVVIHRMREIEKIIRARHGKQVPDPSGTDDKETAFAYVRAAALSCRDQKLPDWCKRWAPWVTPEDMYAAQIEAGRHAKMISADAVAKLLHVRFVERQELGLKTIGTCDKSRAERDILAAERKRDRDRERQRSIRKAEGCIDRKSYEENAKERLRPWVELGISRATYFRIKKRETGASHIVLRTEKAACDTLVSTGEHSLSTPKSRDSNATNGSSAITDGGLGPRAPAGLQGAAPHGNRDEPRYRLA